MLNQGTSEARGRILGRAVRWVGALALVGLMGGAMGGCETVSEYTNLQKSFFQPSEIGRFYGNDNPWGMRAVRPVRWPILDQIDLVDVSMNRWSNATEPLPEDVVVEAREYLLGPGDAVRVDVFELLSPGMPYQRDARVNELGVLAVPNVGNLLVTGLSATQVEQRMAQMLIDQRLLPAPGPGQPGPQVSVMLLESRQKVFSLLGSASRPGTYNILSNDFKLLDALALAGDIPVQPGLDYLYIIRQTPFKEKGTTTAPATGGAMTPTVPTVPPVPGHTPAGILEEIERGAGTQPETLPGKSKDGAMMPQLVRPLPTAMVRASGTGMGGVSTPPVRQVAQATNPGLPDLDAALGLGTGPATAPAGTAASLPAMPDGLGEDIQYVYVQGKGWVAVPKQAVAATGPATTEAATQGVAGGVAGVPTTGPQVAAGGAGAPGTGPAGTGPATEPATTEVATTQEDLKQQRVIRIPIGLLREGVSKYNVVIRPGDVINVPPVEPGEFYMMGHVARPGVYSLTGRRISLRMAVAAAGGLDALALPRRCELTRRIGDDQEVTVLVNLKAIFDGESPDLFMKPNDVVNVGTDAIQGFMAVMRNAFRASYGWGFVYDRNL